MQDIRLELKYIPIDEVVPYINNTRKHPKEQIEQIKASIKEFLSDFIVQ